MNPKSVHKSATLRQSFEHAGRGLRHVFLREKNVRWQGIAFVVVLVLGIGMNLSAVELSVIILVSGVVIGMECINSALEYIEDLVEPQYHEAVRESKDLAAGAVLAVSIAAIIIACLLFGRALFG